MKSFQRTLQLFFSSKKLALFAGFIVVFMIGFQNCAPHLFTSDSEKSHGEVCSLESLDTSLVLREVVDSGVPAAWSTLNIGKKVRFWLSDSANVDSVQWQLMTLASGSPEPFEPAVRGPEGTFPSGGGLVIGNYVMRVTLSKGCAPFQTVFDIPFSVDNGQCSEVLGHFLLADDPKMVNSPVHFDVQLAAGCQNPNHSTEWNFRDGSSVLLGGDSISHPFSFAGLYSALAHLVFTVDDVQRDLYKQVVITSPSTPVCPTVDDLFVSGSRLVYSGKSNAYQLQNVPTGACDLGITSVAFNYADGVVQVPAAPYQVMHTWNPATVPTTYNMQVVVSYGAGLSRTIPVLVTVIDANLGCPADALSSVFITGPASASAGSNLVHRVVLPRCLTQGTNFDPSSDITWAITGPSPSMATGFSVSRTYDSEGLYTLRATIENTRIATFDVVWNLNIYELPIIDNTTTTTTLVSTTTTTLASTTTTTRPPITTTTTTTRPPTTTTTTMLPTTTTTTLASTTTTTLAPPTTTTTLVTTTTTTLPTTTTTTLPVSCACGLKLNAGRKACVNQNGGSDPITVTKSGLQNRDGEIVPLTFGSPERVFYCGCGQNSAPLDSVMSDTSPIRKNGLKSSWENKGPDEYGRRCWYRVVNAQPQPELQQWFCRPVGSSGLYCPTAFGNKEGPGQFPNLECKVSTPGGNCIP